MFLLNNFVTLDFQFIFDRLSITKGMSRVVGGDFREIGDFSDFGKFF